MSAGVNVFISWQIVFTPSLFVFTPPLKGAGKPDNIICLQIFNGRMKGKVATMMRQPAGLNRSIVGSHSLADGKSYSFTI